MRVVVTGATGNVGTSVVQSLLADPAVDELLAIARRPASFSNPRVRFAAADVLRADLDALFAGADAVVHLAWLIQPSRDERVTHATNVDGSRRVFEAVVNARVPKLVYASSVGAYTRGPKDRRVDESWPTEGIRTLFYSRHKAAVEHMLDVLEHDQPWLRVVRMRPGLIFKREAATGIRRLFAGPFLPSVLVQRRLLAVVPDIPALRFQAVHSDDVGDAYRRAVIADAHGAFNIAAEPVLDPGVRRRAARRGRSHLAAAPAARPGRLDRPRPGRAVDGDGACPRATGLEPEGERHRCALGAAGWNQRQRGLSHSASRPRDRRSAARERAAGRDRGAGCLVELANSWLLIYRLCARAIMGA
jgi:UDP-glucose 4-epimerase